MRIIEKNPDTTSSIPFVFEAPSGQLTESPFFDGDGFTPATLESNGFEVWHTGGGCSAHVQRFLMDGKEVHMVISDKETIHTHVTDETKKAIVAVMDPDWVDVIAEWVVEK